MRAACIALLALGFLAFGGGVQDRWHQGDRFRSRVSAASESVSPSPSAAVGGQSGRFQADAQRGAQAGLPDIGSRDFERALREQAATDRTWREASQGLMRMDKIQYRTRLGDLNIPAFVFQPLKPADRATQPALVWVHEDIRGHLYEHFVPFIREAVAQGFVVIAPEYRGSIGYGQAFYDAIDYGGAEVDDVVTAVSVLRTKYPAVDPERIGVIGWSHGGLIALLAVFRNPTSFRAAAAIVPVTNLFQRFAWKGEDRLRAQIDPQNRFGGLPADRRALYRERSPLFHVDELRIPLLVHIARNDEDVNIEEAMPLIDALRARKPALADTKVYENPPGGHLFDRRVDPRTLRPENTPDQVDSWSRVWRFFGDRLGEH
jgi:dipeptidyl aminopeptidase/acylaminoacyl peptidase